MKTRILVTLVFLMVLAAGPVLVAQVVTEATGVDVPKTNATEMQGTMVLGFVSTLLYERLKKWDKFGLITEHTDKSIRVLFGAFMAAATALGVHVTFDATAGTLMVTGLTAAAMGTALWETGQQWAINEMIYRTAIQRRG